MTTTKPSSSAWARTWGSQGEPADGATAASRRCRGRTPSRRCSGRSQSATTPRPNSTTPFCHLTPESDPARPSSGTSSASSPVGQRPAERWASRPSISSCCSTRTLHQETCRTRSRHPAPTSRPPLPYRSARERLRPGPAPSRPRQDHEQVVPLSTSRRFSRYSRSSNRPTRRKIRTEGMRRSLPRNEEMVSDPTSHPSTVLRGTPAAVARATLVQPFPYVADDVAEGAAALIVHDHRRHTETGLTMPGICGSRRSPHTSFTMTAPASSAARPLPPSSCRC